eukprot:718877-Prorocentrum_minimum.AAC.1
MLRGLHAGRASRHAGPARWRRLVGPAGGIPRGDRPAGDEMPGPAGGGAGGGVCDPPPGGGREA